MTSPASKEYHQTIVNAHHRPLHGNLGSIGSIFNPASVAIAGAAEGRIGQAFLACLVDSCFHGPVYPINPRGGEINGIKTYRNLADAPGPVDYVISCIPSDSTRLLIDDCADKGVKTIAFFTAGFSEMNGHDGRRLEDDLVFRARARGIRVLGPNCLGVYNPGIGLSFSSDFPGQSGQVGLLCQSGGNAIYFIRAAAQRGIRFSKAVSYGNAADVDESELLDYFAADSDTKMVAAYIEGVKDGRRFFEACHKLAALKPLIILKGGSTGAGVRAASSHTGALAGSEEAWDTLYRQTNAIRVDYLEEMVDILVTFNYLPRLEGRNVIVCGAGGGFSVITADDYARYGFDLVGLPQHIRHTMSEHIARFVKSEAGFMMANPVDITNVITFDSHYGTLQILAGFNDVDLLVGQFSVNNSVWPASGSKYTVWIDTFTEALAKVHAETGKPSALIIHSMLTPFDLEKANTLAERASQAGLAVFHSSARAALALKRVQAYHEKTGPCSA